MEEEKIKLSFRKLIAEQYYKYCKSAANVDINEKITNKLKKQQTKTQRGTKKEI